MSASRSSSGARTMRVAVVEEHDVLRYGLVACLAEDRRLDVTSAASAEELEGRDVDIAIVSSRLAERHRFACPIIVYGDTAHGPRRVAHGNDVAGALHRSSLTLSQLQATVHAAAAGLRVESQATSAPRDPLDARPLRFIEDLAGGRGAAPATERRAVGYVCVTLGTAGSEVAGHTEVIRAWAAANGVALESVMHDVERRPEDVSARPALRGALERIAAREADTLVTASLAHLSPSVAKLRPLLRWLTSSGRTLVAIDLRLDTATEAGRLAAVALTDIAAWEHDRLSARTRRGLQVARERGLRGGRASVADVPELRERIERMRGQGMTLQAIADALNEDGVPTLRGGAKWRPSSVQRAAGYRRPPSRPWNIDLADPGSPGDDEAPGR